MNPLYETLKSEVERLFTLSELDALMTDYLDIDPEEIGSETTGKAARVTRLFDVCTSRGLVEALADVVVGLKGRMVDPRVQQIGQTPPHFDVPGTAPVEGVTLGEEIGHGGFGVVVEGTVEEDGSKRAVKFVRPEMAGAASRRARWVAFMRLLAKNAPEGVVPLHAAGVTEEGIPFLVMDRVEGETLAQRAGDEGMGFEEAKPVLLELARTLGKIHEGKLVYGDLRPSKVMVRDEGDGVQVTLLAPGNQRTLTRPHGDPRHTLVPSGGAPAYSSPEQIRGEGSDVRTDVYLFGLLACEAVTGALPFEGKSAADFHVAHGAADPTPPSRIRPHVEVPESFDELVARCLEKEPARRFSDFAALSARLEELYRDHEEDKQAASEVRPATPEEFEDMAGEFLEDPDYEEIMEEAIVLARGSGSWSRLFEVFEEAIEQAEDDILKTVLLYRLARVYEKDVKDFDEAAGCYRRILAIDGDEREAAERLEVSLRKARQYEALVDVLLDRAAGAPEEATREKTFLEIADIYERELDEQDKALVVLLPLLTADPDNEEIVNAVTRLAKATGSWDEVITSVNRQLEQAGEPDQAARLCNLVASWYVEEMGRPDIAMPYYQKALAIVPTDDEALTGMQKLYKSQAAYQELASVMQRRIEATRVPGEKRNLKAELASVMLAYLNDETGAMDLYREILEEDPAHDEAFQATEKILVHQERWEELARVTRARAETSSDPEDRRDAYYKLAEMYDTRIQDLEQASSFYHQVLSIEPTHVPSLKALEVIYAQTEDYKGLDGILERQLGLEATPKQKMDLMLRRAAIHEEEFLDNERSLELVDEALGVDPKNAAALATKARLLRKLERWEELLDVMSHQGVLTESDEERVELYCQQASLLVEKFGRFSDSADRLEKALELSKDEDPAMMEKIVEACEKSERYEDAVAWLEKIAAGEEDQRKAARLVAAGEIREKHLSDREGAIRLYRKALDADPGNVRAAAAMRTTFTSKGDHGAALDMLQKEIEATEGDLKKARLYAEMGRIARLELHEQEKSIEYYERAHELDPTLVEAGEPLAELYRMAERWDDALKIFEKFAASAEAMDEDKAAELFLRYGEACLHKDDLDGAKKALAKAKEFAPKQARVIGTFAEVSFMRGEHDEAAVLFDDYLLRMGDDIEPAEKVDILVKAATSQRELGNAVKALDALGEALQIDPDNRDALSLRADLHESRGDHEQAVEDLRAMLETGIEDEDRFDLLVRIGDMQREKLDDPDKAAKSLQAALEIEPDHRATLLKLMQIFMGLERWSKVVDVVLKLADLVQDKRELAKYYKTAATLNDHYLERKEDALTYYELALDNDPSQLKLFDAIVAILTENKDWKALEKAYQKMIDRLPEGVDSSTKANLWHSLGEVYHHRLDMTADAINTYETALDLDPDQRGWQEMLADLYGDDLRYSEKAVRLNRELLQLNPFRGNSYRTLCRIYRKKAKYDEAWCVADTLHALNMAEDEEMEIYEAYATEDPAAAFDRVNEEMWSRYLYHPLLDEKINSIFRIIEPVVMKAKAQSSQTAGLHDEHRCDPEEQPELLPRTMHYGAGVLGIDMPPFYMMRDDRDMGLVFAPTWPPAIAVGGGALEDDDPQLLAFVAGRQLTYYLPGFKLRVFLQSGTALSTWILASIKSVVPQFPVPEDFRSKVNDAVGVLKKGLDKDDMEVLGSSVQAFLESASGGIDLKLWSNAVDFTADRAGLLLCTEMKVATSIIKNLQVDSWIAPRRDRLTELNLFSVSEDYFILRRKLGIAIETE